MKLPPVTIDPRAGGAVKRLAKKRGVAAAVVIRAAVLDYLETHRAEIPPADPDPRQTALPFAVPDFLDELFAEARA